VSPGFDAAAWTKDAKLTLKFCVGYTWRDGSTKFTRVITTLNDGKYAYNNLQAFYTTRYHNFNAKWHPSAKLGTNTNVMFRMSPTQNPRPPKDYLIVT
jgi:hypothetical protein